MLTSGMIKEARREMAAWRRKAPGSSIMSDVGLGLTGGAGAGLAATLLTKRMKPLVMLPALGTGIGLVGGLSRFRKGK